MRASSWPRLLLGGLTASAVALGATLVPVQAAGPVITVRATVVDAAGAPVGGISVYGIETDRNEDLWEDEPPTSDDLEDESEAERLVHARTASDGELVLKDGRFTAEDWTFWVVDERRGTSSLAARKLTQVLQPGENTIGGGPIQLVAGVTVHPVLTAAASGRPVQQADVWLVPTGRPFAEATNADLTSARGGVRFSGLAAGAWDIGVGYFLSRVDPRKVATTPSLAPGQTYDRTIRVTVPCRVALSAKPLGRSKIRLKASATGSTYGLRSPRGTIALKRGGKTVRTVKIAKGATSATVTISQPRGRHRFSAVYSQGDCKPWTRHRTVTVR